LPNPFLKVEVRRLLVVVACSAIGLLTTGVAAAQESDRSGAWRRSERPPESPQRFAFEFRLGPYRPNIDDEFPDTKPYETVFGTDHRVYVGLEFDWQLLRIPKVGTLGPGLGWGYTHMSAKAKIASGPSAGMESAEDTNLAIMPMYGVGVLRVDVLARETSIPLVAYGKAGLGYGLFWTSTDVATQAKGHTWGTHFALGGMLLLDAFDEHAAIEIDNEWGINNSYFFFEWMMANLDGFGHTGDHSVLNIGTNTWVLGLAFEM
jgi:hypothetical protein